MATLALASVIPAEETPMMAAARILATGRSTPAGILSRDPADPWTRELAAALAAARSRPHLRSVPS